MSIVLRMSIALIVVLALSAVVSAALTVHLWRSGAPLWRRLVWTPILWLPVFGWIFYGGFYDAPDVQPPSMRAGRSMLARGRGG
jgi:hypothetical protein